MIDLLTWFNLLLRGLMELGIIVGLATWGYHAGQTLALKLLLAIGAPLVIFSFWSLFDFRGVVPNPEPYRLLQELALSGLAAIAWIAAGRRTLGWTLAITSIVHHILIYMLGGKLLK